jgi:hypothetical protein
VLATQKTVLKGNARVAKDREMEPPRDQGYTRPKVLIMVPMRHVAHRLVRTAALSPSSPVVLELGFSPPLKARSARMDCPDCHLRSHSASRSLVSTTTIT